MTVKEVIAHFESCKDDKVFKRNKKNGAGDAQIGVKLGDIKKLAKKLKTNHELAMSLWEEDLLEAKLIATLIMEPAKLSQTQLDYVVKTGVVPQLADWVNSYVVKEHPAKFDMRLAWMNDKDPMAMRAGWNLTSSLVVKDPEKLDLDEVLTRLDTEMGDAPEEAQWTMNFTLIYLGLHHPEYRDRAIEISEKYGLYKDYPVSKGCITPYAAVAIPEMAKKQNS